MSLGTVEQGIDIQTPITTEKEKAVAVLNMRNSGHRKQAAEAVSDGELIGVFTIQYGALFKAETEEETLLHLSKVKGEKRKSPVAIWLNRPEDLTTTDLVDFNRIHPNYHEMFLNPQLFEYWTQGLCMVRFPVMKNANLNRTPLHSMITSEDETGSWFQVFYIGRNQPHSHTLVNEMHKMGTNIAAITSLNLHGQKPPTNHDEARNFCQDQRIAKLIVDKKLPLNRRFGSYPIIEVNQKGALLKRKGNIHPYFLDSLGWTLQYDGLEEPEESPSQLRQQLFKFIAQRVPELANPIIQMEAQG